MMFTVLGALLALGVGPVAAQTGEEGAADRAAVLAVVEGVFDAMRAADGEALRGYLTDDATLVTTGTREGRSFMRATPASSWVAQVSGAQPGMLNETIHDPVVMVDQNLGVAWTPYRFHLGEEFQHCGVNVFQMLRTEEGWKVFHLADTRRQDGCEAG